MTKISVMVKGRPLSKAFYTSDAGDQNIRVEMVGRQT